MFSFLRFSSKSKNQSARRGFGLSSNSASRSSAGTFHYDMLEPKNLLAGITFDVNVGLLTIEGSGGNDAANVLLLSDQTVIISLDTGAEQFNQQLPPGSVNNITFLGLAGDDFFRNTTNIPTEGFGNSGNDTLVGGGGSDVFIGGLGNDRLFGNGGFDGLRGNDGMTLSLVAMLRTQFSAVLAMIVSMAETATTKYSAAKVRTLLVVAPVTIS